MNWKMIAKVNAWILCIEAGLMLPALGISLLYNEPRAVYGYCVTLPVILLVSGLLFLLSKNAKDGFYQREGFVSTGLCWILMSLLGCLPFFFSREIPNFADCFFEMVSGFTTTGSSILTNVEALDKGLLWWRSFSHWVGGMGVLVFLMAIVPLGKKSQGFTLHILRAESPGPSVGKMVPHMKNTAMILYGIYFGLTFLDIIFLLCGGLDWFSSCCLAFGTAGTGGFGLLGDSFASYSPYIQWVTTIFMLLFSVNFSIYFLLLLGHFKDVRKDEELRLFIAIVLGATTLLVLNVRPLYSSMSETIRHCAFTVATVLSTTGYATTDFNLWNPFSKAIILFCMFCGACAGSTGGGIKVIRLLLLGKGLRRNVHENLHPEEVSVVRVNGKKVDEWVMRNVSAYLTAYVAIVIVCFLLVSLDGFSVETNFSAVMATFNNIGPGLDQVGPVESFAYYSNFSKLVFSFAMLAGRLEIYPIIILFSRRTWRKRR